MWDFDINGDLYFEKAVNGFLCDLIAKWKDMKCNHDITIVLFSRIFYEVKSKDQFPKHMTECIQVDHKGRFYEDFYRVAVQNERIDDWTQTIRLLKTLFNQYEHIVLDHHKRSDVRIPNAVISNSSQGNFLEVLNMSLNVFEKHFMDRSFDRTGQLSIVITPGVGVFEVDRDLTNITKQRIIDNGIGSDLVCLGEQPLHAVPLFKFHSRHILGGNLKDDYNMPHWINLSFYSSNTSSTYSKFVPRIKLPTPQPKLFQQRSLGSNAYICRSQPSIPLSDSISVVYDYDEYDASVFKGCSPTQWGPKISTPQQAHVRRRSHLPFPTRPLGSDDSPACSTLPEVGTSVSSGSSHSRSGAIFIPRRGGSSCGSSQTSVLGSDDLERFRVQEKAKDDLEFVQSPPRRTVVGSAGQLPDMFQEKQKARLPRALINPFDPSQVTIKLTSNRRRWTHVFPLGPTGIFMQQHHYQAIPQNSSKTSHPAQSERVSHRRSAREGSLRSRSVLGSTSNCETPIAKTGHSWLWGTTGEQEWTPALTTGVDWKSLVIPACLPITTDFFPDKHSLQYDYVVSDYSLVPEEHASEINQSRRYRAEEEYKHHKPMSTLQVYQELICQRLQQGFQIIMLIKKPTPSNAARSTPGSSVVRGHPDSTEQKEECRMSIGRIFHTMSLNGPVITVTQYRPRHASREVKPIRYTYEFQAPGSSTYGVAHVTFYSEKLENFNWSYLDHYICIRGEREYGLRETLKYWRLRMLLLPGLQAATRKIIDHKSKCDIYPDFTAEDGATQREAFLKFLEIMNRIKRPANTRRSKSVGAWVRKPSKRASVAGTTSPLPALLTQVAPPLAPSAVSPQTAGPGLPSFRERGGSNKVHDRPRSRHLELRSEPGTGGRVSPAVEADAKANSTSISQEGMPEAVNVETSEETGPAEQKKVTTLSTSAEIVEAMKHQSEGLSFLPQQSGVPQHSFISAEAVCWVKDQVDGIQTEAEAIQLMQKLLSEGYLCHASGVTEHPFVNGFYIYYLPDKNAKGGQTEDADLDAYRNEWFEVELLPQNEDSFSGSSEFEVLDNDIKENLTFRSVNIDIDVSGRSDRPEWGHAQYHSIFQPGEAFEFIMEWMVATGYIIADLVLGWARKANSQGLQLVPIPCEPFVLPNTPKSDPLRCAIFIPLLVQDLQDPASQVLHNEGLERFQEYVVRRFGFIPLRDLHAVTYQKTFVHTTGGMFLMIPLRERTNEELIDTPETDVGFMWSWNYMITKRWKNTATIDENFMRAVMQDFKALCGNQENRLQDAFDSWLTSGSDVTAEFFPHIDH
uniref:DEP domain-containing protein n=1 Tax=Ornithodoros turicata TaxID=34597 RepID=A0A2R5L6X3_9ACAR